MSESKLKAVEEAASIEHYILVSGEIILIGKEEGATPNAVRCNAVVHSHDGRIGVSGLIRAQQALQHQLHQKVSGANDFEIVDVIISNLVHLGKFTAEEFNKLPEGMAIQQRDVATAST